MPHAFWRNVSTRITCGMIFRASWRIAQCSPWKRKALRQLSSANVRSMARWNVPVAFLSSNSIPLIRYRQRWDLRMLLSLPWSSISTCEYSLLTSRVEKTIDCSQASCFHPFSELCTNLVQLPHPFFCSKHRRVSYHPFRGKTKFLKPVPLSLPPRQPFQPSLQF